MKISVIMNYLFSDKVLIYSEVLASDILQAFSSSVSASLGVISSSF